LLLHVGTGEAVDGKLDNIKSNVICQCVCCWVHGLRICSRGR
jgi:hypothetical protein